DGLLEVASQQVYGGVVLGFPYQSTTFAPQANAPPIVQLHGSFSWRFGEPMRVEPIDKDFKYSDDATFIPPAVTKEAKNYPFNKLAGITHELLAAQCDVLRVVGASLTQNDWNVLSLLFNGQRQGKNQFRAELIMSNKGGQRLVEQCSYIRNMIPI